MCVNIVAKSFIEIMLTVFRTPTVEIRSEYVVEIARICNWTLVSDGWKPKSFDLDLELGNK